MQLYTIVAGTETKHEDVAAVDQQRASTFDNPYGGVVTHEIVTRGQDPTENLVCKLLKIVVPATPVLPFGIKYLVTPASVGLRKYMYSPTMFAALCVSPEKPKPFPLLFAPPAPATVSEPVISKAPAVAPTRVGSRPSNALSAPPPAISLVFSSPVGSIGIGSVSSPAVNIGTQSITDSDDQRTWLVKTIMLPYI